MAFFAISFALIAGLCASLAFGSGLVALSARVSSGTDADDQEAPGVQTLILRRRHVRHGRNMRDLGLTGLSLSLLLFVLLLVEGLGLFSDSFMVIRGVLFSDDMTHSRGNRSVWTMDITMVFFVVLRISRG